MTSKTEVINVHMANPLWTAREIADHLGCRQTYVNHVRKMCELEIPRERGRRGESIQVLGKAALAAGLSVQDIVAMGVGK